MRMSFSISRPFLSSFDLGPSVFLVVADGPSLLSDLDEFLDLDIQNYTACCVNRATRKYNEALCSVPQYSYSWHEGDFEKFFVPEKTQKVSCCFDSKRILKSRDRLNTPNVSFVALSSTRGSSTLQAVRFGKDILNMEKIIVIGAPLTGWYSRFFRGWEKLKTPERVRAICGGGPIENLLGKPTKEWLNG